MKEFKEGDIIRFDGKDGDYGIVAWSYETSKLSYKLWSNFEGNGQFSYDFNLDSWEENDYDNVEILGNFSDFIKTLGKK